MTAEDIQNMVRDYLDGQESEHGYVHAHPAIARGEAVAVYVRHDNGEVSGFILRILPMNNGGEE